MSLYIVLITVTAISALLYWWSPDNPSFQFFGIQNLFIWGACLIFASFKIKFSTYFDLCCPITTGIDFFKIPHFSNVICLNVLPKNSLWSNPILVKATMFFFSKILVASSFPPNPVSIIHRSDLNFEKTRNATAVVISKNVILSLLFFIATYFNILKRRLSAIIWPFITILSLNLIRWGDK